MSYRRKTLLEVNLNSHVMRLIKGDSLTVRGWIDMNTYFWYFKFFRMFSVHSILERV